MLKFGDVREDGMIFSGYKKDKITEHWLTEAAHFRRLDQYNKMRQTPKGRAKELIRSAKTRCKSKNRGVVSITAEWVESKVAAGFCELSGLPFDLSSNRKSVALPFAPSLDRIDSKNPNYSEDNTRVVLTAVNTALNEHGLDLMLQIFEAIISKQKEDHGRL